MPENLKVSQIGSSPLPSIQGTSLSRSKKTQSNYLRLLFPKIAYYACVYSYVFVTLSILQSQFSEKDFKKTENLEQSVVLLGFCCVVFCSVVLLFVCLFAWFKQI